MAANSVSQLLSRPALTHAAYARAERFLPWNVAPRVYHGAVRPHWIAGSDRFWYRVRTRAGFQFVLVDPERNTQAPAFDHERLAQALSGARGRAVNPADLPFDTLEFDQDGATVTLDGASGRWHCDLTSYTVAQVAAPDREERRSPDGRWSAFVREHDLWLRDTRSDVECRLTHDGERAHDYAGHTDVVATELSFRRAVHGEPQLVWSPDSRRLVTHRLDQRATRVLPLLRSGGAARPIVHTYRYALPGDPEVPHSTLVICASKGGPMVEVDGPPLLAPCLTPFEDRLVWWSTDGTRVYFVRYERGYQTAHLCVADAASGAVRTLLTEHSDTWVDIGPHQFAAHPPVRALTDGTLLWWSERGGWGHLYLVDGNDGRVLRQVTSGDWQLRELHHVDATNGWVYFTAGGAEAKRNPYYLHLYRVRLTGGAPELLTPEDAHHDVAFAPSGGWFVDRCSRIDQPPLSLLRAADGELLRVLEQADVADLLADGWRFPEPFRATARDGVTDIYGMITYPSDFDPARSYPILDNVYPGPHNIQTDVAFPDPAVSRDFWQGQALAELGFVVITIDGLGTAYRSKTFHAAAWGPGFGEAGGLPDHVAALAQLAADRPYLDLERVGIYGHSGGGFAAARGMLLYPDLYRVGVASAGNHDQRDYHAQWGELYLGADIARHYHEAANAPLAERLRGKLLLVHGELDDDVHPRHTLQLAAALLAAEREVDLLILPAADHELCDPLVNDQPYGAAPALRYFLRRRWDYFVTHLLGVRSPDGYMIRAGPAKGGDVP